MVAPYGRDDGFDLWILEYDNDVTGPVQGAVGDVAALVQRMRGNSDFEPQFLELSNALLDTVRERARPSPGWADDAYNIARFQFWRLYQYHCDFPLIQLARAKYPTGTNW